MASAAPASPSPPPPCNAPTGHLAAPKSHVVRQREAEATVDARLGYLGLNLVAVPDA
jgi:hypothetical protein